MYKDVNVIDIEDGLIRKKTDPTEDVKNFFTDPFSCFTNLRLVLQPIQAFEHPAFRNMI